MTKKLTPIEKFNRNIDRHLNAITSTTCETGSCDECVLNNYGIKARENVNNYGHLCGLTGIKTTIKAYRSNFKQF